MEYNNEIKKISFFVACASVLQVVESLFPHPLPGIRLGLANMITLVALVNIGFRASLEIAVLRCIVSSFILGTFLSPTFLLSFSGSLISALVMGFFYKLTTIKTKPYLSLIGISLIGSITHNLVQIGLVYFLIIRHKGVFLLLPWLAVSAVIMGWITGIVATRVCQKLDILPEKDILKQLPGARYQSNPSFINYSTPAFKSGFYSLSPSVKIIVILFLILIILLTNNLFGCTLVLFLLLGLAYLSRVSPILLFSETRKLSSFLLFSFAIPVFFDRDGKILLNWSILKITQDGLTMGGMVVFRIALLMISSALLIRTTSPDDLASGLKTVLSPLKLIGVPVNRIVTILTSAWLSVPIFWERSRCFIKSQNINGKKLKALIPILTNLIVTLYNQIDEETKINTKINT